MFCPNCSKIIKDGSKFCQYCGADIASIQASADVNSYITEKSAKHKKSGSAKFLVGLVSGALVGAIVFSIMGITNHMQSEEQPEPTERPSENIGAESTDELIPSQEDAEPMVATTIEGPGYDTPEEAVVAYLEAMKKGDVPGMLSTFAVETYIDNYDLIKQVERTGGYTPGTVPSLKSVDNYTRSINISRRRGDLVYQLRVQYFMVNEKDDYYPRPLSIGEGREFRTSEELFNTIMNPEWTRELSQLEYGDIWTYDEFKSNLSTDYDWDLDYQRRRSQYIDEQGCDEFVPLIAEVKFRGEDYFLSLDVVCYDNKWYNVSLGGLISQYLGASMYNYGFVKQSDVTESEG